MSVKSKIEFHHFNYGRIQHIILIILSDKMICLSDTAHLHVLCYYRQPDKHVTTCKSAKSKSSEEKK